MEIHNSSHYTYDYFSGANVGLYVREVLVGTAVGVEFSLIQNKRPVYGYASQLWDGVARGTVQCSGFLMINFQYAQYLPTLISRYHNTDRTDDFYANKYSRTVDTLRGTINSGLHDEADEINEATVLTPRQRAELKQHFWNGDSSAELTGAGLSNSNFARPDDHSLPFDVIVTYGDAFGNELRRKDGQTNYTLSAVRTLRQVQLTGFGQTITVEGEPVLEQYPFICREVT